ncbi:30S ribosomal protein S5 [Candidatus Wolfebacteria bacterium]|nr:30S ribosomal protein S5 [Candidatus Wolfebacteria bacterium]
MAETTTEEKKVPETTTPEVVEPKTTEDTAPKPVEATATETKAPETKAPAPKPAATKASTPNRRPMRPKRRRSKAPRERQEFEQRIIEIRRVVRVVSGGRRFSFSVAMVIGDQKGRVGVGLGKATDTALAIEKSIRNAKKNLITINRTETGSIPFDVQARLDSSEISLIPSKGRGLVAGSAVRTVLEFGGVTDVVAKILTRSKSKLSIARATVDALKQLS